MAMTKLNASVAVLAVLLVWCTPSHADPPEPHHSRSMQMIMANHQGPVHKVNYAQKTSYMFKVLFDQLGLWQHDKLKFDLLDKCSTQVMAPLERCLVDLNVSVSTFIESTLRSGHVDDEYRLSTCCSTWKYRKCMVSTVRSYAHYSLNMCDDHDVIVVESELEQLIHEKTHELQLCTNDYALQFYCQEMGEDGEARGFLSMSLGMMSVVVLGMMALMMVLLLIGMYTYRMAHDARLVQMASMYKRGLHRRCPEDGVELVQK